jgi:hypothetical protein
MKKNVVVITHDRRQLTFILNYTRRLLIALNQHY